MAVKSPELELAQQKIRDLEDKLKAVLGASEGQLVLLPNKDLHRGLKMEDARKPNIDAYTETIPADAGNPLNVAMAKILTAAQGGHALTCLWCGLQWQGQAAEKDIREHLKKEHSSVVEGYDKVVPEMLMANLEEAKQRLAAAESK